MEPCFYYMLNYHYLIENTVVEPCSCQACLLGSYQGSTNEELGAAADAALSRREHVMVARQNQTEDTFCPDTLIR